MFRRFGSIVLLSLLLAWSTFAAEYQLFKRGQPHERYDQIVAELQPGDVLKFSNGKTFTLVRRLDEGKGGNLNSIFELSTGGVIRIPRGSGIFTYEGDQEFSYRESITEYIKGAALLKRKGVPVVGVNGRRSVYGEYALTDKVEVKQDFDTFTQKLAASPDDPELKKDFEQLKEFFRRTALVTQIGDLHAGNLVQTEKGWLALDFRNLATPYRGHSIVTFKAFENMARMEDFLPLFYMDGLRRGYERLPAELKADLNDVVEQERDRRIGIGLWHRFSTSCYLTFRSVVVDRIENLMRKGNR